MNSLAVSFLYISFSLISFFSLYFLSRYFSGDKFRWKWFVVCTVSTILIASVHMSTVEYGYEIMIPALKPILKGNDVVGWTAFISMFLQTCCVPTQYEPRKRFWQP